MSLANSHDVRWPAFGRAMDWMFMSFHNVYVEALLPSGMALYDLDWCLRNAKLTHVSDVQHDSVSDVLKNASAGRHLCTAVSQPGKMTTPLNCWMCEKSGFCIVDSALIWDFL